jgi:hypothetical protein
MEDKKKKCTECDSPAAMGGMCLFHYNARFVIYCSCHGLPMRNDGLCSTEPV